MSFIAGTDNGPQAMDEDSEQGFQEAQETPSAPAWPKSDISEVRIAHSSSIAMLASCFVAL